MISVILLNKIKLVEIDVKIIFVNYVVHHPHNYSKKTFPKNLLKNVSMFVKPNFGLTNLINWMLKKLLKKNMMIQFLMIMINDLFY